MRININIHTKCEIGIDESNEFWYHHINPIEMS